MAKEHEDDRPRYPEALLMGHIAQKGYQAGSIIGLLGVVPVMALRRGGLSALSLELVTAGAAYGALGGLTLLTVAGLGKRSTIDTEGVEDRAYRLQYNQGQNRVDKLCAVGSTVGLAAAAYLLRQAGQGPAALNLFGGAALGCAAGVVAHVLISARAEGAKAD